MKMKKIKLSKTGKKILLAISILLVPLIALLAYGFIFNKDISLDSIVNNFSNNDKDLTINIVNIDSTTRPYAVMINNLSTARKYHSGLQDAYITYEIIVEGGVTRYLALFKDVETEVIGSVRSARHYFIDYALENDAYFVHWGWSPQAESDISTLNVDNINALTYEGKYFYREDIDISYEHTGYTKMSMLTQAAEKLGYRLQTNKDLLLEYSAENVNYSNETTANNVDITFSQYTISKFVYDEENEYYLMSVNDVEHVDYITGKQYNYKNIITYRVENQTISGESTRQEIFNIGTGEGYYISNGKVVEILWSKESRDSQTIYTVKDTGEELVVNDGNTYIGIQPLNVDLSIY